MPKAVKYAKYGGVDVLEVVEVERPEPGPDQVVVAVAAAGINPGEMTIREGRFHERWPATFPSGQGSDLAGTVAAVGTGVTTFAVGDEVLGFTDDRASQAEYVAVPATNLTAKPPKVSWPVAGSLFVVGTTAYAAVAAVGLRDGDTVVVSGAAGGVGSLVVQLARRAGATVIGLAGEANHGWLADHGAVPLDYRGADLADRVRRAAGGRVDAFVDTFGDGYVQLALDLGVDRDRIDTIIDFTAAAEYGVRTAGNADAANAGVLAELAGLVEDGELEIPIARTYRLDDVREAYRELERRHTRGKLVLVP